MGSVVVYHVQKYEIHRHYIGQAPGKSRAGRRRRGLQCLQTSANTSRMPVKSPLQMPRYRVRTFVRRTRATARRTRATARAPASRQAAVGGIEVHSCINIYNLWQQFRDKFAPWKSHLRTTIRRVEETAGFVVFPKCLVVFSKCCLRVPSGACRATIAYVKTPEQARVNRRSAPMQCKDNTFFAEIQIARFRVNISRSGCAPEGIARAKNTPRHGENRLSAAMFKQKSLPLCRTSRLAAILGAGVWTAAGRWGTPPARWLHHHLIIPIYI